VVHVLDDMHGKSLDPAAALQTLIELMSKASFSAMQWHFNATQAPITAGRLLATSLTTVTLPAITLQ
jgi:hypothetical protein